MFDNEAIRDEFRELNKQFGGTFDLKGNKVDIESWILNKIEEQRTAQETE